MNTKILIIFIDSLPFYLVNDENTPYLNTINISPLQPGIGYSINIYYELFAGLTPEELGIFNKWTIKKENDNIKSYPGEQIFNILDKFRFYQPLSRCLHKLYEKLNSFPNLGNIPFSYLKNFTRQEDNVIFNVKDRATIFNAIPLHMILSINSKKSYGKRDEDIFRASMKLIDKEGSLFVMFSDLDWISHVKGIGKNHRKHMQKLDSWCNKLIKKYKGKYEEEAEIIIVSDHGMAPVVNKVKIDLERLLGPSNATTYLYFIDSVFLRLWTRNDKMLNKAKGYLTNLKCGKILNEKERNGYGINPQSFGDLILVLDEGKIFYPGFMGGWMSKAMHGYLPELERQAGILGCIGIRGNNIARPSRAREIYKYIMSTIDPEM